LISRPYKDKQPFEVRPSPTAVCPGKLLVLTASTVLLRQHTK